MLSLEQWLEAYSADHLNAINQKIHRVCVPAISFAVAGLLHLLPFYFGDALIAAALLWYARLGLKAVGLMFLQLLVAVGLTTHLSSLTTAPASILIAVFVLGWLGQFYGHQLEGRRPSFLRDLQYLLIGPLWVWLGRHSR